jgi:hypothetical protein
MPSSLVIDKTQSIKKVSLKQFVEEDLYKKPDLNRASTSSAMQPGKLM